MPVLDLLKNKILWAVVVSGLSTQVLKAFASIIWEGRMNWRRTLEPGGMPSSHAASAATLATLVGSEAGFDSLMFALTAYIGFVVMYDAAGVRRSVGRQAILLNRLLESRTLLKRAGGEKLRELLGHTPVEVLVGFLLGIGWALAFQYLW